MLHRLLYFYYIADSLKKIAWKSISLNLQYFLMEGGIA